MKADHYYNEIDPFVAQMLRNLIKAGHIAPGDVDERSIEDVKPYEIAKYTQCHFFAGIGIWSYALRLAEWPDSRRIWTGSCPCQPFSAAGEGGGFADERHLWPAFYHLIEECRPARILGEQVASKRANPWIDLVQDDMEALGYAFGAIPFPASGAGAPNIRERIYWVADAPGQQHERAAERSESRRRHVPGYGFNPSRMAYTQQFGSGSQTSSSDHRQSKGNRSANLGSGHSGSPVPMAEAERGYAADSFWSDADWLYCQDGRWRPVESGTFPLADGDSTRVGRLRAYGNAINPWQARLFIRAVMESVG